MAFLQSKPPREPFLHAPASVLWLIAVLAAAHIARIAAPAPLPDAILNDYAFIPARYGTGDLAGFALSFVSYIFLHLNFTHLGVNCLWLLAFGPIVARRYGTVLFLVFFMVCGAAGALASLVLMGNVNVSIIGASGAISGLMAAGIRLFPWPGLASQRAIAPILSRPVLLFSGTWLAANLLLAFTGFGVGGPWQPVAWQAHLGGYFAGLVSAGWFDAWRQLKLTKIFGAG
jgi:membrane associated rhomboid family serine protease